LTEPKGCHNCGRDPKKEACGDFCNGFHSAWIPQAKPLTLTDLRREAAKWRDHPECVPGSHLDEVVGLLEEAVGQLARYGSILGDVKDEMILDDQRYDSRLPGQPHGCYDCAKRRTRVTLMYDSCPDESADDYCCSGGLDAPPTHWEPKPTGDGEGVVE